VFIVRTLSGWYISFLMTAKGCAPLVPARIDSVEHKISPSKMDV
jgi:hypothetical protein